MSRIHKTYKIRSVKREYDPEFYVFLQNEEALDLARFQAKHQTKHTALQPDSVIRGSKRNLEEIIVAASEDNVCLRRKLDLIKYRREKVNDRVFRQS